MMESQQQQKQPPASFRSLFAALDVIIEEAVKQDRVGLMTKHAEWHEQMKDKPSAGCHACVLLGMAQAEEEKPDDVQVNGGPKPDMLPAQPTPAPVGPLD